MKIVDRRIDQFCLESQASNQGSANPVPAFTSPFAEPSLQISRAFALLTTQMALALLPLLWAVGDPKRSSLLASSLALAKASCPLLVALVLEKALFVAFFERLSEHHRKMFWLDTVLFSLTTFALFFAFEEASNSSQVFSGVLLLALVAFSLSSCAGLALANRIFAKKLSKIWSLVLLFALNLILAAGLASGLTKETIFLPKLTALLILFQLVNLYLVADASIISKNCSSVLIEGNHVRTVMWLWTDWLFSFWFEVAKAALKKSPARPKSDQFPSTYSRKTSNSHPWQAERQHSKMFEERSLP